MYFIKGMIVVMGFNINVYIIFHKCVCVYGYCVCKYVLVGVCVCVCDMYKYVRCKEYLGCTVAVYLKNLAKNLP